MGLFAVRLRMLCALTMSAGLLAGCATDRSLPHDARFNAGTPGQAEDKGLILVGLRVGHEPVRHSWILGDRTQHPTYIVSFSSITEDGKLGRNGNRTSICGDLRILSPVLSECVPDRLQYKMLAVPPGRYALNAISYTADRVTSITSYMHPVRHGGSGPSTGLRFGDTVGNPEKSFVVRAGEITYVGDLNFEFTPRDPFAAVRVSRDDAAAQGALATYPNITGTPVFRPVVGDGSAAPLPRT